MDPIHPDPAGGDRGPAVDREGDQEKPAMMEERLLEMEELLQAIPQNDMKMTLWVEMDCYSLEVNSDFKETIAAFPIDTSGEGDYRDYNKRQWARAMLLEKSLGIWPACIAEIRRLRKENAKQAYMLQWIQDRLLLAGLQAINEGAEGAVPAMKQCPECSEPLPANARYFNRHGRRKDGLDDLCVTHRAAKRKAGRATEDGP